MKFYFYTLPALAKSLFVIFFYVTLAILTTNVINDNRKLWGVSRNLIKNVLYTKIVNNNNKKRKEEKKRKRENLHTLIHIVYQI